MTGPIDYQAVLADLEARKAQIEGAIAGIRAILGEAAPISADDVFIPEVPKAGAATPIPGIQSDTFFGLSTPQAVRKFLSTAKRPQSPRAIADALHAGGQIHAVDPKTAYTNVYTALKRGRDSEFSQTRNGEWGLAEWYSNKGKNEAE